MGLFGEVVDRFFVGKLAVGLLFIASALQMLRAVIALTGRAAFSVQAPGETALLFGAISIMWLLLFRFIETRRKRRQGKDR